MKSIIMNIVGTSILVATLILGGTFTIANIQKVNAQMGNSNMTGGGGASGGMMGMMGNQSNITGSVKLSTVMGNALASQIKVSLSQAATTAENTVGNNSHAAAAHFGIVNGYLIYTVWVIDGSYTFHRVIVDAGNRKVLLSQPVSKGGPMMGHGMMMGDGMMMQRGPHGMMMGGPGMSVPWHRW